MEAALYVAAYLVEVLPRPGDVDAGQVVVGGPDQDQLAGAGMKRCAQAADPAPVGVVTRPSAAGAPGRRGRRPSWRCPNARRPRLRRSRPAARIRPTLDDGPARPRPCRQTTARHARRSARSAQRRTRRPPQPAARPGRSAAGSRCRPRLPPPARCRIYCTGPGSKVIWRMGAQPRARSRPSSPQACSRAVPRCQRKWVDMVSLGNDARSTRATRCPARASSMASGAPPHRAPTTMTSYTGPSAWRGLPALADRLAGGQGLDVRGVQRVAGDAPVAAFHFLDDHPGDRRACSRPRSPPWRRSAGAPCPASARGRRPPR